MNDVRWNGPGRAAPVPGVLATTLIGAVRFYRIAISPMLPQSCRFWPSCSEYSVEALRRHGALRGGALMIGRICRCHPWSAGGVDNVPVRPDRAAFSSASLFSSASDRWRAYRANQRPGDQPIDRSEHSTDSSSR